MDHVPSPEAREADIRERVAARNRRRDGIGALDDPIERLVAAVRFVLHDSDPHELRGQDGARLTVDVSARSRRQRDELVRLCPEFCAGAPEGIFSRTEMAWRGSWDSHVVGAWFAARRTRAGVEPDFTHEETVVHKGRRGRAREVLVAAHRGWTIPDRGGRSHLLILRDGRIVPGSKGFAESPFHSSRGPIGVHHLLLGHLDEIARILGLPRHQVPSAGLAGSTFASPDETPSSRDGDAVLACVERRIAEHADDADAWMQKAQLLLEMARYDDAVVAAERWVALRPDDDQARELKAKARFRSIALDDS